MSIAFGVALALLAAAVLAPLVGARRSGGALAAAGCGALLVVGFCSAGGWSDARLDLHAWLGFGEASLRVDRLSGLFSAIVGGAGFATSLAYLERARGRLATCLHAVLLLVLALVLTVDQAFVLLLVWELLTVSLYLLVAADRERPGALLAAYFTGALAKVGGAALLAAFGLMYAKTGSFELADWARLSSSLGPSVRGTVFVLLLVGFGTKLGTIPFQSPLPPAYAAAPGPAAATISIALVAGFYGFWRLAFGVLHGASLWWGELVLALGALSALVGILYAVAEDDLDRFLGFSTVENSGICLLGAGVALVGQATGKPLLAAAGLLAGTMHVVSHTTAKALAFLAAERVARATGEEAMRPLGGLARLLGRTAAGFGVATLTLAAIPPLGGFVSEWLTFEALLQGFRLQSSAARLFMVLAAALLALTAGLALLAFAKAFGTTFLGRARGGLERVREPRDLGAGMLALALLALALGPLAPWEVRWLGRSLSGLVGFDLSSTAVSHPLVLGPVYPGFSVLAPTWLAVVLPAYAILTLVVVWGLLRAPARRAPVWVSGSAVAPELVQYTPAAYANPVRVVLRGLYGFQRRLVAQPPARAAGLPRFLLETRVVPAFEHYLYRPLVRGGLRLSIQARGLQSGRLGAYLLYILVVLLVVLAVIPAIR